MQHPAGHAHAVTYDNAVPIILAICVLVPVTCGVFLAVIYIKERPKGDDG